MDIQLQCLRGNSSMRYIHVHVHVCNIICSHLSFFLSSDRFSPNPFIFHGDIYSYTYRVMQELYNLCVDREIFKRFAVFLVSEHKMSLCHNSTLCITISFVVHKIRL